MGWVLIPGRAGKIRSLRLVLNGNNPRFPWEPSTTMLTYRLTGTTDESVSNRDEPNHCADSCEKVLPALSAATGDRVAQSSLAPASPDQGSTLLTCKSHGADKIATEDRLTQQSQ